MRKNDLNKLASIMQIKNGILEMLRNIYIILALNYNRLVIYSRELPLYAACGISQWDLHLFGLTSNTVILIYSVLRTCWEFIENLDSLIFEM